jgi:hypothetical protein
MPPRAAAATALVLAVTIGLSGLSSATPATAVAAASCQGQPATIEASAGTVTGTSGDDVIVVTGSVKRVSAGDGDDLICLVDTRQKVAVDADAGDDEVDASAAGAKTDTYLGPGADSFTGSAFNDYVTAGTLEDVGTLGDPGPDQVATGPGPDTLVVRLGAVVDADLGRGDDSLLFYSASGVPASQFDLGVGRDKASFQDWWEDPGAGDTSLLVDLTRDLVKWHDVTFTLHRAENISGAAESVVLLGDRGRNELWAHGCDVVLKGAAGDDSLSLDNGPPETAPDLDGCSRTRLRAYGNAGDDHLRGGNRHEVLIGGPGLDSAFGGRAGRDRCEAERTWGKGCKRS